MKYWIYDLRIYKEYPDFITAKYCYGTLGGYSNSNEPMRSFYAWMYSVVVL